LNNKEDAMKALLIYPEFPDGFWSFKHALKFVGCKAALPPLGLITMAAMLPETWDLRLVDMNVRKLTETDLSWADCAFVSAMVVQQQSAKEAIARCNKAGIPVIAGGPLFTEESEQFPEVDHLILGEAEEIFPCFLTDFKAGCAARSYKAAGYSDIRTAPVPRWDLLDMKRYASMSVQFSRGCPFDCDFCDITVLFGRRPRVKTPGQMIAELDALWNAGWHGGIFFVDDNFIGNKPYLKTTLLPALIAWQNSHRKPVSFYTEVSINLADDEELVRQMVAAGFDRVFIGIETPEEKSLLGCNKLQNTKRDLTTSIKKLQNMGLEVQAGFIVGFDSDAPSIFKRQFDFIQASGIPTAMVGILQAFPRTKLYQRLQSEGRIRGLVSGDSVNGTTNIVPKMISLKELVTGYQWVVHSLYAPKNYYRRVRTFLREYHPARISGTSLNLQGFLALARSFLYLGILGKERFHYWGLIVWMLFRRPRLFPAGVTLSIFGYHFRKVAENIR
jgi:radical SAM superfamily enzyme YgiQ (UPF0313 family)